VGVGIGGIMKFKTVAALALSAIIPAGCQTVADQPPPLTIPYTLSAKEIDAVKKGVEDSLKDPTSALFRSEFKAAKDEKGAIYVCGLVNGKNSFGGYVGDKPFMGVLANIQNGKLLNFDVTSMGGTDIETAVTMQMCRRYGVLSF
jgi:hypothetical protein